MDTKLRSSVSFEVAAHTPQRILTQATDDGLAAARARLAPGGHADAVGSLGSARGETRRVKIELTLRVHEGGAAAGMDAERAFAEAFVARVERAGHSAARAT